MADSERLRTVAAGRHLELLDEGGWEFVRRRGATGVVAVVAVTPADKMLLVSQFRVPLGKEVLELPAGLAGDVDSTEALVTAAQRELVEETGYEAAMLERLFEGPSSSGLTDEIVTFFLASGIRKVSEGGGDDSEQITVHEVPLDGIERRLGQFADEGMLLDPKVYAGLYFLNGNRDA